MKRVIRKFFFAAAIVVAALANAEAQNSFAYQAVIRTAKGELVSNKEIAMQFSLIYDGKVVYCETQTPTTSQYGNVKVEVGNGRKVSGDFAAVPWSSMQVMMKIEADPNGGTNYIDLGTIQLQPAPYAMYATAAGMVNTVEAGELKSDSNALFEVKDKDGNVVFAVYRDGVRVFVDDTSSAKAMRTGFAVSGRRAAKEGGEANYFEVTADGTQVFVDEDTAAKAMRTGFAVSGRRAAKDGSADLFTVSSTGTQVYIDEDATKAVRTGFAVAGRRAGAKDGLDNCLEINTDGIRVYIDNDEDSTKAIRTGFAVSGRRAAKEENSKFLEINADGTKVYVDDDEKAMRTGFAVAGRRAAKGKEPKLFEVNSFGTQIYIDTEKDKAMRTGFAVSGRRAAKKGEVTNRYMVIDADGTRIYVDYEEAKAMRTGFAVSGRRAAKNGTPNTILKVDNAEGTRAYIEDNEGKAMQTGFAVSGRRAAKEGAPDLLRITSGSTTLAAASLSLQDKETNKDLMSISSTNTSINTDDFSLSNHEDKDMLTANTDGVEMKTDLVVAGEVTQNVAVEEINDIEPIRFDVEEIITIKVADSVPALEAPNGYSLLKIYGNGVFAQTKNVDAEGNTFMLFNASGNLTTFHSEAAAAVIMTNASTSDAKLIVWPLKQVNNLPINFGLMAAGDTSNRYVPVEVYVNADGPVECLVDVKSADEELGKVRIEGLKVYGSKVEIHADAIAEGYHFAGWSDERSANPRTVLILHDTAFASAKFEINTYNITTSAENGTVEIVGESNDDGTFNHDTKIELKAIASDNYHFANWTDGDTANPREFTIVSDTAFEAVFVQDEISKTVTVTFVSGNDSTVVNADYNTTITEPDTPTRDNYQFGGWYTDEKFTTSFDFSAPVTENITVYAKWILNSYSISIAPVEGGEASVSPAANADYGKYSHGTRVTVTASPKEADGYEFVEWAARDMALDDAQKKSTVLEFEITSDVNLRPVFALKKYLINATAEEGGSISTEGLDQNNYAEHGTEVTLTAQPSGYAYEFAGWESDNLELTDEQKWSETIEIEVKQAFDITAKFALKKYLVQTGGGQNGKVTVTVKEGPEPENDYYVHGTVVKFTAEPNGPDYEFGEWLGSVINTLTDEQKHSNEIQVTVTSEIIAQATFKQKMAVTFNANGGKFGNDDAVTSTTIYVSNGGKIAEEQIPAAPTRDGYTLIDWLDADGNPFDFSTEINGNIELTAQWVREFYVATRSDEETGGGTIDNPFASVQKAFNSILAEKKTNTDYRIVVLGTLEGGQSMGDFFEEDNGKTATTLEGTTITLVGQEHNQQPAVIDATKDEENDPIALQVFTNIPVTIENLTITGGRNREAGGIQISSEAGVVSHVTLGAGAIVTDNYVLEGGGGGVSVNGEGSTFKMLPGSKITNNIAGTEDDVTNSVNGQGANGGGVYVGVGSTFVMAGGVISGNEAVSPESDNEHIYGRGGGVYNEGTMYMYGSAVIGDTTKKEVPKTDAHSNMAKNGGGIFNRCGELWIGYKPAANDGDEPVEDNDFAGGIAYNYASANGGGIGLGGYNNSESNHINKGKIAYNAAAEEGGGIGRISDNYGYSALYIDNSTIVGNKAGKNGGGLYLNNSYLEIDNMSVKNTTISNNTAGNDGGGLYFVGGKPIQLSNCIVTGNVTGSDGNGGGIYFDGNDNSFALDDCQVTRNSALKGAGVYLVGDGELHMNGGSITDNVLHEDQNYDPHGKGVFINYSSEMYVSGAPEVDDEVYGESYPVVYIECEKKYVDDESELDYNYYHDYDYEKEQYYNLIPLTLGTSASITVTPEEYETPTVTSDGELYTENSPQIIGNCTADNCEYFSVTSKSDDDPEWCVNPDGYLVYFCLVGFTGDGTGRISNQTVMLGGKIDNPTDELQEQEGKCFAGWVDNENQFFYPDYSVVTGDMTLTAQWVMPFTDIYVNATSDYSPTDADKPQGGEDNQFTTIQDAVDLIASFNQSDLDYTIHVTGMDNNSVIIPEDRSYFVEYYDEEDEEFKTDTVSFKIAKSILVKGETDGSGIENPSYPVRVYTSVLVTFENIKVTIGNVTTVDNAMALVVGEYADVTLASGTDIDGGKKAKDGTYGVFVLGKLTMDSASIHDFGDVSQYNSVWASSYISGGIRVGGSNIYSSELISGEFKMKGTSSIYGCFGENGGAIHLQSGKVTMEGESAIGGSGKGCIARSAGGAVYVQEGDFVMDGSSSISYCTKGRHLSNDGSVTIYNGRFTMKGDSKIHNNTGSGVYVDASTNNNKYNTHGTFKMEGGSIKNNSEDGVYVNGSGNNEDSFGVFEMSGGTISDNIGHGVFVYVYSDDAGYAPHGIFKMSGSANVDAEKDDVYLCYSGSDRPAQAQVTIAGALDNELTITPKNYNTTLPLVAVAEGAETTFDANFSKFKVSPYQPLGCDMASYYNMGDDGTVYVDVTKTCTAIANMTEDGTIAITGKRADSNQAWLQSIASAIHNEDRKITLDLSDMSGETAIGSDAFKNCSNLAGIVLPQGITQIGGSAFSGTSIALIDIPDGVTTIGENAFNGCGNLESVVLPASLTTIETGAFAGCSNLKTVYFKDSEDAKAVLLTSIQDNTPLSSADWICNSVCLYVSPNGNNGYYNGRTAAKPCKDMDGSKGNLSIFDRIRNSNELTNTNNIIVFVNGTMTGTYTLYAADGKDDNNSDVWGFYNKVASITFCGLYGLRNGAPMAVFDGNDMNKDVFNIKTTVPITFKNLTIKNGRRGIMASGTSGNKCNVTIGSGAHITGNGSDITNDEHCGVRLFYADLTLDGGKITANKGKLGGGVCLYDGNTKFTMKSGIIEGNEAQNGGGVYVPSNSTFTMQGGTISGNTASTGNGVSCLGNFKMSGSAYITADNDVWLTEKITITRELTTEGTVATITPSSYGTAVKVLDGESSLVSSASSKFAVTPNEDVRYVVNIEGKLVQSGALGGKFTINDKGDYVYFSPGNLQYKASGGGTWQFAENQYAVIGAANENIGNQSYGGFIDLFGWGTGNHPTENGTDNSKYSTFTDWGTNAIDGVTKWRTLTQDEWYYLINNTRMNNKHGIGKVNGVPGHFLLPDDWSQPSDVADFIPGYQEESSANSYANYSGKNEYTIEQWAIMEQAGAVFLPSASARNYGDGAQDGDTFGHYWTSTPSGDDNNAWSVEMEATTFNTTSYFERSCGFSVRLVQDR